MADLLRRRRARADPRLHRRGLRGRHQLLRHRQRLRPRRRRVGLGRDPLRPPARLLRAGDQGLGPDVRRSRPTAASRRRRSPSRSTPRCARLRTDYVDLYQAHRFDPDVPIEETIEALQQVVADGKARYLGFSEWTPEQIQAAHRHRRARTCSSPPSRSTRCSGGRPRPRSSRSAPPTASRRSSGRRSPRACSPASTAPARPPPPDSRAASSEMNVAMEPGHERRDAGGRRPAAADRRGRRA